METKDGLLWDDLWHPGEISDHGSDVRDLPALQCVDRLLLVGDYVPVQPDLLNAKYWSRSDDHSFGLVANSLFSRR
jgi:hypothetical protein